MAIQVLQQPPQTAFAGDPIVVKAKTTLTGKTFLSIKITVNVTAFSGSEEFPYSEDYSFGVASDGIAIFNIGETVKTALSRKMSCDVSVGGIVTQPTYAARYTITYRESYLMDMVEVEEGETTSEQYQAIPGCLTEFERLTSDTEDTTQLLGDGRLLTRKPEGDIVPIGFPLYIPAVDTVSNAVKCQVKQGEDVRYHVEHTPVPLSPVSVRIDTSELREGGLVVSPTFEEGKTRYVVKPGPLMRYFLFLNGFGLLESVVAFARESLEFGIRSSQYVLPEEIDYRSCSRTVSYAKAPSGQFAMSSGYVTLEWAEWWLCEFVVTRRAWMYADGKYLPVTIIPEEDNTVYDRSKPGLVAVNFTVQYAFAGGTLNSFV